jgi:hypothetical protein
MIDRKTALPLGEGRVRVSVFAITVTLTHRASARLMRLRAISLALRRLSRISPSQRARPI